MAAGVSFNNIKKIGIVGSGQMGNGIAQVASQSGYNVILQDISSEALQKAMATIANSCDRLMKKDLMTEGQKKELLGRIQTSTDMQSFKDCDVIIEAATENVDLKLKIFKNLDQIARPGALLATNTSSISITKIAAATQRPELVAGMHFMNPVP